MRKKTICGVTQIIYLCDDRTWGKKMNGRMKCKHANNQT